MTKQKKKKNSKLHSESTSFCEIHNMGKPNQHKKTKGNNAKDSTDTTKSKRKTLVVCKTTHDQKEKDANNGRAEAQRTSLHLRLAWLCKTTSNTQAECKDRENAVIETKRMLNAMQCGGNVEARRMHMLGRGKHRQAGNKKRQTRISFPRQTRKQTAFKMMNKRGR